MSVMSNPATVGSTAATERVRRSITGGKADVKGTIFMLLMLMALLMSVVILAVLVIDMVTQGNKVIFGTTFGYMDVMQKLGEEFKAVGFYLSGSKRISGKAC